MQEEEKQRDNEQEPEEAQETGSKGGAVVHSPIPTGGMAGGEEPGVTDTAPDVDSGDLPTGSRGIPGVSVPEDVEEENPESDEAKKIREILS